MPIYAQAYMQWYLTQSYCETFILHLETHKMYNIEKIFSTFLATPGYNTSDSSLKCRNVWIAHDRHSKKKLYFESWAFLFKKLKMWCFWHRYFSSISDLNFKYFTYILGAAYLFYQNLYLSCENIAQEKDIILY